MQKLNIMLLGAFAACSLGAAAQSVTIVFNDGTNQKFGVDYIKNITFEEVVPVAPKIDFTDFSVNVYSSSNVGLTLKTADGSVECAFDLYCPYDSQYLPTGIYTIGGSGDLRIDNNMAYTYYQSGADKKGFESGTLTVSAVENTYTFDLDAVLADGSAIAGSCTGELTTFNPYVNVEYSAAKYHDNAQAAGCFLIKLNSSDWNYEGTLYINSETSAFTLFPGTYNYSADGGEFTIDSRCYFNLPSPYREVKAGPGSKVTVSQNGDNTLIDMEIITPEGLHQHAVFDGVISGTPNFNAPARKLKKAPVALCPIK